MSVRPDLKPIRDSLFPAGTDGNGARTLPIWPPDVFAFAATVAERLGIYSNFEFNAGWDGARYAFPDSHRNEVTRLAELWNANAAPPKELTLAWARLMATRAARRTDWQRDVFLLLAVSDEASTGMGFAPPDTPLGMLSTVVFQSLFELQQGLVTILPHLPASLCWHVPPTVACVQPKTNTPTVGCTLRSASNHLALLPPTTLVATSWLYASPADATTQHFNMLVVPYPYRLEGGDFRPVESAVDPKNSFFSTDQPWLGRCGFEDAPKCVVAFLSALVTEAEKECGIVHAVVLPELALDGRHVRAIAEGLGGAHTNLEVFITGVLDRSEGAADLNCAYTVRYLGGEIVHFWRQPKHHRWKLEQAQIKRYSFGYALDPERDWWECIDVSNRSCAFSVIRPGASLATLVCEDLARFDPVMPVINSMGPSLLIGLLMDGPQWERRWPGRYATVLAEDPGCAVLTVTSLGMIRRSTPTGASVPAEIALWKQPGSQAEQLTLPPGSHALVLALTIAPNPRETLDRRRDANGGCKLKLSGVQGVKLTDFTAFPSLEVDP